MKITLSFDVNAEEVTKMLVMPLETIRVTTKKKADVQKKEEPIITAEEEPIISKSAEVEIESFMDFVIPKTVQLGKRIIERVLHTIENDITPNESTKTTESDEPVDNN
ncbi:MAG: hypothetical protein HQK77_17160 [Desulfobacterales bacterium]|nr:hypothetical protein [Desulfobacterales bacterium]